MTGTDGLDLLVRGGTIVTGRGSRRLDVGVRRGAVAHIGAGAGTAKATVDATGLLVLPGGVDTHVHLMDPGSTDREDFPTGTGAAAAAGVTTVVEHSHGTPVTHAGELFDKRAYLQGRSHVDYALAAHAWPGKVSALPDLWSAGAAFFKLFTCTTHGIPGHDAGQLKAHLAQSRLVDAVTLMHCEDESLTGAAEEVLRAEGRDDAGLLLDWRNRDAELVAVAVASLLVRRADARAVLAHVSSAEVASYVAAERSRGARLFAETCPQYLTLFEAEVHEHGALRKFTPPARARTDADHGEMWALLRAGVLTHVSSDHAPSTLEQKTAGDIWKVHFGLPGLDTTMSILLDAAAGRTISYEDVVRLYCETPARVYGLWPRKGRLALGSDADMVLVDPSATRVLRDDDVLSKAGWTPYAGRTVTGRVQRTYLRGELVAEGGRPVGERAGEWLPGAGAQQQARHDGLGVHA